MQDSASSPGVNRALRVLLCDDNADAAATLALLFQSHGHSSAICYRADQCIAKAREWRPHLAIIDIGLPDLPGYAVASAIRMMDFGADVTLIAYTGYDDPHDIERATEAGFDVHLSKSADPGRLIQLAAALKPDRP